MMNRDVTYCNGKGCSLTNKCKRYLEGQRIIANPNEDKNQYWWMDYCEEDSREAFVSVD